MMTRVRAIALSFCVLVSAALPGWNSAQISGTQTPAPADSHSSATVFRIQSQVLRVEFDRKLYSRVVPLFAGAAKRLVPFSASETVRGVGHPAQAVALWAASGRRIVPP